MYVTLLHSAVSARECLPQIIDLHHLSLPLEASFEPRVGTIIDYNDMAVAGYDGYGKSRDTGLWLLLSFRVHFGEYFKPSIL